MAQVKEVMTSQVESITPDSNLEQAAQKMRELNVGSLPVAANDQLLGILTDRDIVVRCIAQGQSPKQVQAQSVMSEHVEFCRPEEPIENAVQKMKEKQIHRIPVVNEDYHLQGIIALADLATRDGHYQELATDALEKISVPA